MRFISIWPCTDWGQCDNKTSYMQKKSLHTFSENKKSPHLNAMSNAQLNCQSFSHKIWKINRKRHSKKGSPSKNNTSSLSDNSWAWLIKMIEYLPLPLPLPLLATVCQFFKWFNMSVEQLHIIIVKYIHMYSHCTYISLIIEWPKQLHIILWFEHCSRVTFNYVT